MDKIDKIQESRERLLNDLYASVRYTPDPQTDLVAMMAQYIKEEPENRPPLPIPPITVYYFSFHKVKQII